MARILLLEDEAELRRSLREVLEKAGHSVDEAADGVEGIRRFVAAPADLVITDIRMPWMSGHQAILELRKTFPEVRIIAVSGGAKLDAKSYVDVALQLGADKALTKPFRPVDLLSAVHDTLNEPQIARH